MEEGLLPATLDTPKMSIHFIPPELLRHCFERLVEDIPSYQTRTRLLSIVLVSRLWEQEATPLLWKHVALFNETLARLFCSSPALERNVRFVRIVNLWGKSYETDGGRKCTYEMLKVLKMLVRHHVEELGLREMAMSREITDIVFEPTSFPALEKLFFQHSTFPLVTVPFTTPSFSLQRLVLNPATFTSTPPLYFFSQVWTPLTYLFIDTYAGDQTHLNEFLSLVGPTIETFHWWGRSTVFPSTGFSAFHSIKRAYLACTGEELQSVVSNLPRPTLVYLEVLPTTFRSTSMTVDCLPWIVDTVFDHVSLENLKTFQWDRELEEEDEAKVDEIEQKGVKFLHW